MEKKWLSEPNYEIFIHNGLTCVIKRTPGIGTLCGYVGVPRDHSLFGLEFDIVNEKLEIQVHGGLTFSNFLPDEQHSWFFGFDCAHAGDLMPSIYERFKEDQMPPFSIGVYRDWDFVTSEIKALADELSLGRTKFLFL